MLLFLYQNAVLPLLVDCSLTFRIIMFLYHPRFLNEHSIDKSLVYLISIIFKVNKAFLSAISALASPFRSARNDI